MQHWKTSDLAKERQAELDAARAECEQLNINVGTASFVARYTYPGRLRCNEFIPFTPEEQQAVNRYNAAVDAVKRTKEDFIFAAMRKEQEEARARGVKPLTITHADPQQKRQS